MSAYALVSLGRHPHTDWTGRLSEKDHDAVRSAICAVGAQELAGRNVAELSDGERQKIMIARALAQDTEVMVLDEITAFLDLPRRVEVLRILRDLARTTQRSILLSTHDLDLALRSADKIWLLPKGGPLHAGTPEELVLSGVFESAFQNEGVDFDAVAGSFRLHHDIIGEVWLDGEGVHAAWTARAFEREGFRVIPCAGGDAGDPYVRVVAGLRQPRWIAKRQGIQHEFETLSGLVNAFRQERKSSGTGGCN
jgi:iron complex transport system ATP-binding protein